MMIYRTGGKACLTTSAALLSTDQSVNWRKTAQMNPSLPMVDAEEAVADIALKSPNRLNGVTAPIREAVESFMHMGGKHV